MDDQGSIPGKGSDDIISLHHCVQTGSRAQSPIQWVLVALSPGGGGGWVKRLGRAADGTTSWGSRG
jgi:hypothetical protein